MLPWNHIKALLLGTSVLWAGAPAAPADDAAPARPAASERPQSRTAAERWNRLKSQYTTPAAEAASRTPDRNPVQPASAVSPTASAAALQEKPARNPQWRLPEGNAHSTPAEPTAVAQSEELPAPSVESPLTAARPAYESQEGTRMPDEISPPDSGTPRPIAPQVPAGPPRKATQIRKMSDIAPLNDFNKETDIQKYAAEKAREFNVRFGGDAYAAREYPEVALPWVPPHSKFYPLYFQDPALERYGHSHHPLLQPVVSSARMSAQLVMMPYQMTVVPPWELHSPLGYYRPGDVVPKLRYPFPWSTKAALVEAASVTGFIYLIP